MISYLDIIKQLMFILKMSVHFLYIQIVFTAIFGANKMQKNINIQPFLKTYNNDLLAYLSRQKSPPL